MYIEDYTIQGNVLRGPYGHSVVFPGPIERIILIGSVIIVMLDSNTKEYQSDNVYGVNSQCELLWKIEPRQSPMDNPIFRKILAEDGKVPSHPYTNIRSLGEILRAYNWDGHEVDVDPTNGKIIREQFVK